MANDTIKYILMASIFLLLAAALIGVIAEQTAMKTQKTLYSENSYSIASARFGYPININESKTIVLPKNNRDDRLWKSEYSECDIGISNWILNSTYNATATTDYILDGQYGTLTLVNSSGLYNLSTAGINTTTTLTLSYCPDDALVGWSNTILKMVAGFIALIALAGAVFYMYEVYEEFK